MVFATIDMNQPWIYMCSPSWSPLPPPSPSHPSGSSQCTSPEHLFHASSLGWWSVSPLIVYLFQCYSLRTSHPHLLPQSSKVCSVHHPSVLYLSTSHLFSASLPHSSTPNLLGAVILHLQNLNFSSLCFRSQKHSAWLVSASRDAAHIWFLHFLFFIKV